MTIRLQTILALLLTVMLAGWAWLLWQDDAANHDIFWLYTGFNRLTDGQTMAQAFYETNPPLSVFIYAPAFWITQHGWLSLPHAIFVYGLAVLALSLAATILALRRIPDLTDPQKLLICLGLLVCGTILTPPNFGQRDHLLALAIVPVLFLLLSRTRGYEVPAWQALPVLFIGTFFLLLKPYYGLLPGALMLHRAFTQRRISALWDSDFLSMAAAFMLYLLSIALFFPDYVSVILPAVIALYADSGWSANFLRVVLTASLWLVLVGLSVRRNAPLSVAKYARPLLWSSALSFLIFGMMMKGYSYHLLPCLTFMFLAALLIVESRLQQGVKDSTTRPLLLSLILTLGMLIFPDAFFPDKKLIKEEEITKIVAACGNDCTFLLMGGTVRTTQLISYYAKKNHASRFPKFWFLEGLVTDGVGADQESGHQDSYRHYADMIAEDIDLYKPQIIFSCDYIVKHVPLLSRYESFRKSFYAYKAVRNFSYNYNVFHGQPATGEKRYVPCTLYQRH